MATSPTGTRLRDPSVRRDAIDGARIFFYADGELLIVPQQGDLRIVTEFGVARRRAAADRADPARRPLPRRTADGPARGYVCENYGGSFRLPDLGPIGANGLANPRDFETPVAALRGSRRALQVIRNSRAGCGA